MNDKELPEVMPLDSNYARLVKLATFASIAVAFLLILTKFLVLALTESSTMLASLTDSVMDLLASLINFIAIRYAMQPADSDHRYGHFKAESLASLAQCTFILGSSLFLIMHGAKSIINPSQLENLDFGIIVSLIALVVTAILTFFQGYVIKKTKSSIIEADRLHYLSDIFFNVVVLLSLVLSNYGILRADGIFSVILGLYIAFGALRIGKRALNELLDKELPQEHIDAILALIISTDGVLGIHDLRTRSSGPKIFIQGHLEIYKLATLEEAHHIADKAEETILSKYPNADITLHMEPTNKEN